MGFDQKCATIFCDSQSAIHLSKNVVFHERTKHIDVKFHFAREIISKELVKVKKIYTNDNPADMLTKVIPVSKLKDALNLLNVVE